ncbi:hypothetical protein DZC73_24335 [Albitalea terrae]|uniref:Uncharacterized protein n=2 Tax=Piscinibacter terrae TaxID=2496871 RepID=A0A3N7HM61_9BURK|nr:hypothetical protein DZC73_24335 [Albitalea terrae]
MRAAVVAVAIASALGSAPGAKAAAAAASAADQAPPLGVLSEAEQRQRDREKLLGLEERLERQHQESQAAQQQINTLQAKLREVDQARRGTDPAIYGLGTIALGLLITVIVLLVKLAQARSQRRFVDEARAMKQQLSAAPVPMQRTAPMTVSPSLGEVTHTSMRVMTGPIDDGKSAKADTQPTIPAQKQRRELTAEEVIDLEQQADFFIAIGQEDQAIDLLMTHVRSSGGTSPMPYLKLLGIYHGRSDGDAYERIRERFNRRFNGFAPSWDAYGKQGRDLEAYEGELRRVVAAWKTPAQLVTLLQSLLFRRDASSEVFDLPAFEELLILYAVARDVLEHVVNPDGVDLLLPIGAEDKAEPAIMHYEATRPPESWMPQADIELDIKPPKE